MSSLDSVSDDDDLQVLVGRVVISILQTAEQEAERIVDDVSRNPEPVVSAKQVAAWARECLEADDRCRSATHRLRSIIENRTGSAIGVSQTRLSVDEASISSRAASGATDCSGSFDLPGRVDQSAQPHFPPEQVGTAQTARVDDRFETHAYRSIDVYEPSAPSTIDTTQADTQPSVELETAAQEPEAEAYVQVEPTEESIPEGRGQIRAPAHARSKDRTEAWSFLPEIVLAALAIVGAIVLLMLFVV